MWKNIVGPDRPHRTIWRIRIACCIPKATNTHSECVILIAFTLQRWLQESATALLYENCLPDLKLVREWNSYICGILRSCFLLVLFFRRQMMAEHVSRLRQGFISEEEYVVSCSQFRYDTLCTSSAGEVTNDNTCDSRSVDITEDCWCWVILNKKGVHMRYGTFCLQIRVDNLSKVVYCVWD